jgi:hypothetical protein
MMIERVYVDMDGVLANTIEQITSHLIDWPDKTHNHAGDELVRYWLAEHPGVYDPHVVFGVDPDELWASIAAAGEEWWSSIPEYDHMRPLMDVIIDVVRKRWDVLSHPQSNIGCYVGKLRWLKERFGPHFTGVHLHADKAQLAAPGRVLIDDCDRNIRAWAAAGGIGITFPQPWNRLYEQTDRKVEYVASCLERAQQQPTGTSLIF